MSYDEIKALAKELRRPITTLLALKDENDPFAVDRGRRLLRRAGKQEYRPMANRQAE
jgi:hypothetical protein